MRRFLSSLLLLLAGGCATPVPVDPTPPAPIPTPPQPPPQPVPTPSVGLMTQAQFDSIADGALIADVVKAYGDPLVKPHEAAGFTIYRYAENGTTRVFYLFVKDGKIDHKGATS